MIPLPMAVIHLTDHGGPQKSIAPVGACQGARTPYGRASGLGAQFVREAIGDPEAEYMH